MSTQIQRRGGTTAQHALFKGAPRELTVDTDKNTVVVHDGSTYGGFPLALESALQALDVRVGSLESVGAPHTGLPRVVVLGGSTSTQQRLQGDSWVDAFRDMMMNVPVPHEVINLSMNQQTFYRAVRPHSHKGGVSPLAAVVSLEPDVLIVCLGGNDGIMNVDGRTLAQVKADADYFFSEIASALPSTKVLYARPRWWDYHHSPALATNQSRYMMPVHWELGTTGPFANKRALAWAANPVAQGTLDRYEVTRDLITHIESIGTIDGFLNEELWMTQRLGCTGPDLLHTSPRGTRLLAAGMMEQLETNHWNIFGWSGPLVIIDPHFDSLYGLFSEMMSSDGTEWSLDDSITIAAEQSASDENHWLVNPWSYYCRYKMWVSGNAIGSSINDDESLLWSIWNGARLASVSVYAPSMGISNFHTIGRTTFRGDYMNIGRVTGYATGSHEMFISAGADVLPGLPFQIDAT